jgi:hypothetical protein
LIWVAKFWIVSPALEGETVIGVVPSEIVRLVPVFTTPVGAKEYFSVSLEMLGDPVVRVAKRLDVLAAADTTAAGDTGLITVAGGTTGVVVIGTDVAAGSVEFTDKVAAFAAVAGAAARESGRVTA